MIIPEELEGTLEAWNRIPESYQHHFKNHRLIKRLPSSQMYPTDVMLVQDTKTDEKSVVKISLDPQYPEFKIYRMLSTGCPYILYPSSIHRILQNGFVRGEMMVYPYCVNGDLMTYFGEKRKEVGEARTQQIFKQLFEAIAFLQEHRIIHHDLKPENILFDKEYNVKLCDFGLAKWIPEGTNSMNHGRVMGTPDMLAPEMDHRGCSTMTTDIWGLGEILTAILLGHLLHNSMKYDLNFKLLTARPHPDPVTGAETLSDSLLDFIPQLLKLDPDERLTVEQIREHLWFQEKFPPFRLDKDGLPVKITTPVATPRTVGVEAAVSLRDAAATGQAVLESWQRRDRHDHHRSGINVKIKTVAVRGAHCSERESSEKTEEDPTTTRSRVTAARPKPETTKRQRRKRQLKEVSAPKKYIDDRIKRERPQQSEYEKWILGQRLRIKIPS